MSYTNGLDKPSDYFITKLYTGNGADRSITGVGFRPDFLWAKNRSGATAFEHRLCNSTTGSKNVLFSSQTFAEQVDQYGTVDSFDADGFSITTGTTNSTYDGLNVSGDEMVTWHWKANGGTTSSNTDGSITTTVQANTTSGFSIISYTGTGGTSQTLGHSLGVKPTMFIVKCRSNAGEYWGTWIDTDGDGTSNYRMSLNTTDAAYGNDPISFSNSLITLPSSANTQWDGSGRTYIAYCFADTGNKFFKAGKYTGNGSASGPYIYTGHKPAAIIIKRTDVAKNWYINDNLRLGYNNNNPYLSPNLSVAETGGTEIDILSNGFRITASGTGHNQSGGTYIYASFAENPFVTSTGIPTTAR